MRPELSLLYVHGGQIGYSRLGTELARALTARGVDVYDHLEAPEGVGQSVADRLVTEGRRWKQTNTVCWISVPTHARGWWMGQHAAMFTMWEAARLPETFRETLHEFDTLIVPSYQNVELFSKYHKNVKLCLLGVDPVRWAYRKRRPPGLFFDFLVGGAGPRKGLDLAATAFRRLWGKEGSWGDGPVPRLRFKSPKNDLVCNDIYLGGSRMEMLFGRISAEEEAAVYADAHCYIGASRGEGFGLQPLQAIAQGCPTILTDAHGHASFAHLGIGISAKPAKAAYFIYGDAGDWWEPSLDELCEAMRDVYDNYDRYCDRARMASKVALRDFTWARTAASFCQALDGQLTVPYSGTNEWYTPEERLYPVVCNKDWVCDIGGIRYHFKRGEQTFEMADVKRILFEAELLDPACLSDDDTGLAQNQVPRIEGYRAEHSACPTCGGPMNGPSRADALFAEYEAAAAHG